MGKIRGGLKSILGDRGMATPMPMISALPSPNVTGGQSGPLSMQLGEIASKLGNVQEYGDQLTGIQEGLSEMGLNAGGYYQNGSKPLSPFMEKVQMYRNQLKKNRGGGLPDKGVDTENAKLADGEFVVNREGVAVMEDQYPGMMEEANAIGLGMRRMGVDPNPVPVEVAPGSDGTDGFSSFGAPRVPADDISGAPSYGMGGPVGFNMGGYFNTGLNPAMLAQFAGKKDSKPVDLKDKSIGTQLSMLSKVGNRGGYFQQGGFLGLTGQDLGQALGQAAYSQDLQRQQQLAAIPGSQVTPVSNKVLEEAAGVGAGAAASNTYNRPLNIRFRDSNNVYGEGEGREKVVAARIIDGTHYIINPANNEWEPATEVLGHGEYEIAGRTAQDPSEAGAGGIPNAISVAADGSPTFQFRTQQESKFYLYTTRAIAGDQELTAFENANPDAVTSAWRGVLDNISRGAAGGNILPFINKGLSDAGLQEYAKATSRFLQSVLRADTGAAYTEVEFRDYAFAFSVTPGSTDASFAIRSAQNARKDAIRAMASASGQAAEYLHEVNSGTRQLPGRTPTSKPTANQVEDTKSKGDKDASKVREGQTYDPVRQRWYKDKPQETTSGWSFVDE